MPKHKEGKGNYSFHLLNIEIYTAYTNATYN